MRSTPQVKSWLFLGAALVPPLIALLVSEVALGGPGADWSSSPAALGQIVIAVTVGWIVLMPILAIVAIVLGHRALRAAALAGGGARRWAVATLSIEYPAAIVALPVAVAIYAAAVLGSPLGDSSPTEGTFLLDPSGWRQVVSGFNSPSAGVLGFVNPCTPTLFTGDVGRVVFYDGDYPAQIWTGQDWTDAWQISGKSSANTTCGEAFDPAFHQTLLVDLGPDAGETWGLNAGGGSWQLLDQSLPVAPAMASARMAYFPPTRSLILVVASPTADTSWRWSHSHWVPSPGPAMLKGVTAMTYDPKEQALVAVAGSSVWTFNGVAWTEHDFDLAEEITSIAYDPFMGKVVAVTDGSLTKAGVLTWAGSAWKLPVQTQRPGPEGGWLAFDSSSNELVRLIPTTAMLP